MRPSIAFALLLAFPFHVCAALPDDGGVTTPASPRVISPIEQIEPWMSPSDVEQIIGEASPIAEVFGNAMFVNYKCGAVVSYTRKSATAEVGGMESGYTVQRVYWQPKPFPPKAAGPAILPPR